MKTDHEIREEIKEEALRMRRAISYELIRDLEQQNAIQIRLSLPWRISDDVPHTDRDEACHIVSRFTTDNRISYVVFQHDADELVSRTHCHIYLWGYTVTDKTIRKHIKEYCDNIGLTDRDRACSTTAGESRDKITVQGAWRYGTTPELLEPVQCNFEEDVIHYLEEDAKSYYEDWYKKGEHDAEDEEQFKVLVLEKQIQKPDNVWRYLQQRFTMLQEDPSNWTVNQFKKFIMKDYIKRGKALPRANDMNRYAKTLWLRRKQLTFKQAQETPLDEENRLNEDLDLLLSNPNL